MPTHPEICRKAPSRPVDLWAMLIDLRIWGKIIGTVLCCIVHHNCTCTQLYAHSWDELTGPDGLGLVSLCVCVFLTSASLFVVGLVIKFVFLCYLVPGFLFGCQYQRSQLPGKNCPQNDLLCFWWDVKLYSLTHSVKRQYLSQNTNVRAKYIQQRMLSVYLLCSVVYSSITHGCLQFSWHCLDVRKLRPLKIPLQ